MNELIKVLMERERMSKCDVVEMVKEAFESCDNDLEDALWNLGLEPDYCYDLMEVVAK